MSYTNSLPFETRYKKFRILNFGKPYTNYKTYNIKYHPENKTNIFAIYVDNQKCNNIPTNKSLLQSIELWVKMLSGLNDLISASIILLIFKIYFHIIVKLTNQ